MSDLPEPPQTPGSRVRHITGKAIGAGAGAVAGSFVANPALGALAGAAAGEGIEQAVRLVTLKMKDPEVPGLAVQRFTDFLGEYLEENPQRMDEVLEVARGSREYLDDALTTYAALHKHIATQTQGVRQEVLMRGLAHFATSEDIDVATFSHATQTVMGLTRRQLGMLALLDKEGRPDPKLLLSDFSAGTAGVDPYDEPSPQDHAKISRYKEIHDLMSAGLVMQKLPVQALEGLSGTERTEAIRRAQPRDWSEVDVTRLDLSAAGYVIANALDLGQLDMTIQQELLKELDPMGHQLLHPSREGRTTRHYEPYPLDSPVPDSELRIYDQEADRAPSLHALTEAADKLDHQEQVTDLGLDPA